MNLTKKLLIISLLIVGTSNLFAFTKGPEETLNFEIISIQTDTIPIQDSYSDFLTDPNTNPFDIKPSNLEQKVEYDPGTNSYVVFEKIGEEYYKTPVTMTFKEYLEWRSDYEEKRYFNKLAGVGDEYKSKSGITDPISRIDIKDDIVDRLFGGSGVTIKPQGNIDLTILPLQYQFNANPNIFPDQQTQFTYLDFNPVIQMNVDGGIGDKMDLNFNYNTQSTFDFDQKIKLAYDSEEFNEDDIIKKIEAGNVSLPLRSSLIQGAQQLFGLKTELQFGHLRLTAIASQQKSQQENLQIQNGAQVQKFEIRPDEYDEDRHYFISHYHRNNYERTLENLPYLNTAFRVNRIQVWVSNDRPEFQENTTMIAAISDLGQGVDTLFTKNNQGNPLFTSAEPYPNILLDRNDERLPDNRSNNLYHDRGLETDPATRRIENTTALLTGKYGLKETDDFETFRGRLLSPSEYTFNPELGFISLNIKLKSSQVLGIAYDYYYTFNCDTLYTVGELSEESTISDVTDEGEIQSESVIYVKMLKNSAQDVNHPTWDLMMKNVYALRTNQLNPDDFSFDIYFEDDEVDGSLKKFLPFPQVEDLPLLNMFNLDRLNSQNDKQPDGVFDFVPGVTVIPRNGAIIFPKLEPFGSGLDTLVARGVPQVDVDRYKFQELYDESLVDAQQRLEQNKFVMVGEYKSDVSSEISLGAWNLPPGSLRVRAGSQLLVEGQDYEVDYGSGRLRILNETYLQQGVPLDISFEDTSVFSFQQKSMLGLRADYALSKHANIGATYLRLFERPFTEKVNIGDDPINNRIFGIDFDYSKDAPWLTKAVDRLPIYSTKEASNILFTAEVAALRPGHPNVINLSEEDSGVVNIDDFEGAVSGLPLGTQTNRWTLSSVPSTTGADSTNLRVEVPESTVAYNNNLTSNANRALLNWYVIDRGERTDADDHPYARAIDQDELFERAVPPGQFPDIYTFDLTYYPDERGPYNFDLPDGRDNLSAGLYYDPNEQDLRLNEPESRWGGITRYMQNNDFQSTNYEFIDFWMLNPYMEREDGSGHMDSEKGRLVFQLGNISEDVIKDGQQFFENAIPTADQQTPISTTNYGEVPLDIPVNNGFEQQHLATQDVGFDGLTDAKEIIKYQDWIQQSGYIGTDPSNDNFLYYGDAQVENEDLQTRYKRFNNPEGNAPTGTGRVRGNPIPDSEDLNNNKSLNTAERYYEYTVNLFPTLANQIGTTGQVSAELDVDVTTSPYYTETKVITRPGEDEKWYRFRIPLNDGVPFNDIQGFRSIQFMRMITTGFKTQKTIRMAEFELVRNQWRRLPVECASDAASSVDFSVDVVGVEENSTREPFQYTIPRGIKQEVLFSTFANVLQDEKSLAMDFCHMQDSCEVSIFKLTELDMRFFEKLQMFVHAEATSEGDDVEDDDLALFIRLGKDFVNNYYEYEIPLKLSNEADTTSNIIDKIWRVENKLDVELKNFTDIKKIRNANGSSPLQRYSSDDATADGLIALELPEDQKIYIKGNPTLGFIKGIQVGVRNVFTGEVEDFCGEVWINELRAAGFKEQGGVAGLARLDVQMADLGNVTLSGNYSSIGWGGLDQKLSERQLDEVIEYDAATNLELGKFLPSNWKVSVPFYAQYAKSITNPLYDAYALDLTLDEVSEIEVEQGRNPAVVLERSQDVTTIKTINFTNVRKERGSAKPKDDPDFTGKGAKGANKGGKGNPDDIKVVDNKKQKDKKAKPMPWDISNFSVSYAYTETNHRDPFLSIDDSKDYRASLDYNYSNKFKGFKPFDKIAKKPYLKVIKELNLNPLPSSFTFNTNINRYISTRRFRLPEVPIFEFDDRIFDWRRRYNLKWDLMKNLKMNFVAENRSIIDELRQTGIADTPTNRDWVDERGAFTAVSNDQQVKDYWIDNLSDGGRNTDYNHQLSLNYTLPTKNIRILNWIQVKAIYKSDYSWIAGPLIEIDKTYNIEPGAVIQNSQDRSINGTFNFDKLYSKSKYLKKIEGGASASSRDRRRSSNSEPKKDSKEGDEKDEKEKDKKKERKIGKAEKILVRPLLSLRTIKLNYKENLSTLIPGFQSTPVLFGLDKTWSAPGWQFASGLQPNLDYNDPTSFLREATDNNLINPSQEFNQQLQQNERQNFEATVNLEPWKYFKIDVDFSKSYSRANTREFKNKLDPTSPDFQQFALTDIGSFEVSYINFATLFDSDVDKLFQQFLSNRSVISGRLNDESVINTTTGQYQSIDGEIFVDNGETYREGFKKTSTQVMIPAFLATYNNKNILTTSLDLEESVRDYAYFPKPNWKIRYDGLTKIPRFQKIFSSFTIEHGYRSSMGINQFRTDPLYRAPTDSNLFAPFESTNIKTGNYYSRLDIPSITISEQFSPLIGITIKTKSDFLFDVEYKKSRDLDLTAGINGATLTEVRSTGMEAGIGYTFKNVVLFKGGKKKRGSGKVRESNPDGINKVLKNLNKEDEEVADADKDGKKGKRGVNNNRGSDLVFNFDFSFRDDVTFLHEETTPTAVAVRGTKTYTFQPSAEYEVNKNFALRTFMSYRSTVPYATTQFENRNFQFGITLRFKLE